jgi:endo-1,4-beta-xylanase
MTPGKVMDAHEHLMDRRAFLRRVCAVLGVAAGSAVFPFPDLWAQEPKDAGAQAAPADGKEPSLRASAAAKGLIYGAAASSGALRLHKEFAARFAEECAILVPEWELKWQAVRPTPDDFDFASADWLAAFAAENHILFRGHTLVWHDALPAWFHEYVNKQNAERILREHIGKVVGRYKGRMHSWDVVNEAVLPMDNLAFGMRNSPWLKLLGPGYVDLAFRRAAEADPDALLVLNQNWLEYGSWNGKRVRAATLGLLTRLKASNVPVHALGIQAHLELADTGFDAFEARSFRDFLRQVADLGLKIVITELDVDDAKFPADISTRDRLVAEKYEQFLSAALPEPAVIAVLTWGLSDKWTWIGGDRGGIDNLPARPLPLDENGMRKPAWEAIRRAFENAPQR